MKKETIKQGNNVFVVNYDKEFENDKYRLLFNTRTGMEVLYGINGNNDPFVLELPSMCDIGIMGHCHNKCSFCYQGDKEQPHMKLEDFRKIILQVKHHTNQVALGGRGDPNKHPKFFEIIWECVQNGVVPNYTTSGKYLNYDEVRISQQCGAVAVSDYGKNFTYNAIGNLMEAQIKTNIHFVVTRTNIGTHVEPMLQGVDIWDGKVDLDRLNAVIFLLYKPAGRAKGNLRDCPLRVQYERIAKLFTQPKCKFKIGMDSCMANHIIKHAEFSELQRMAIDTCESSRMSTYITPDMRMVPCSFADHKEMGVPIGEKTIREIWSNSEPYNIFRRRLTANAHCCPAGF